MYKVIKFFTDLQDNNHTYNVGDTFPREGLKVSQSRLNELTGPNNKQRKPLIEKVPEKVVKSKKPVEDTSEVDNDQEEKTSKRKRK